MHGERQKSLHQIRCTEPAGDMCFIVWLWSMFETVYILSTARKDHYSHFLREASLFLCVRPSEGILHLGILSNSSYSLGILSQGSFRNIQNLSGSFFGKRWFGLVLIRPSYASPHIANAVFTLFSQFKSNTLSQRRWPSEFLFTFFRYCRQV